MSYLKGNATELHTSKLNSLVLDCNSNNMYSIAAEALSFAETQSKKQSTCKGSRNVVLDLDVHKESRQSERHVALTAQAYVMETCRV